MDKQQLLVGFGSRLRALREERGLSQERLGELAGLHRTYICDVESGNRNVALWTLYRLARALHVRLSDLLDDDI